MFAHWCRSARLNILHNELTSYLYQTLEDFQLIKPQDVVSSLHASYKLDFQLYWFHFNLHELNNTDIDAFS